MAQSTVPTDTSAITSTNSSISSSSSPSHSTLLTHTTLSTNTTSITKHSIRPIISTSSIRHSTNDLTRRQGNTGCHPYYGFDLNPHWQEDKDHYDNQKINGLTFPRSIRQSAFTQKLDIEGCDPLQLPVAALLDQQANNFWLRKLAHGRELYLIPTGDIAAVVFMTELLTQLRNKGVDLDKVSHSRARQDGKLLDKTNNNKYAAQQIADLIHSWVPTHTADPETQHELTQLRSQLAQLRQRIGEDTGETSTPATTGPSASSPAPTPIQQALLRNSNNPAPPAPPGFDPSSLLVGTTTLNPWLAQHMPSTLAVRAFNKWLKELPLSEPKRKVLTDNIAKTEEWWAHQPSEAIETVERVAVMMGIPVSLLGKNYDALNLLRVMTAAISLTNWLAPHLRRKLKHKVLQSHLQILQSMILVIYLLTPFTMTHSIHLFQGFRIIQTRMMVLTILHGLRPNQKLKSILEGCADLKHLWGHHAPHAQPFLKTVFPASERLQSFHPHWEYATQILYWICHAPYSRQRVQPLTQVSPAHQRTAGSGRIGTAVLARSWQPVYMGSHPNIQREKWLSQSRNGPHPRVATQTQLPFHLSILPSQKGHPQETSPQYERPVWPGHLMASCQTQVHSETCSQNPDIHTVSKPFGTLDHHPCLGIKYKGKVRTDEDAQIEWRWPDSLLCSSPIDKQHPRAFPHSFSECYWCLHQMVARETGPTSLCTSCSMVPHPQPPTTIQEIPTTVASPNPWLPGPMPQSIV